MIFKERYPSRREELRRENLTVERIPPRRKLRYREKGLRGENLSEEKSTVESTAL
jgi:hypothetical protein